MYCIAFCLISLPLVGQNHLVVKPNQTKVLDLDPGPLSYILVQGHLKIDYPSDGELRAGRIIIDGGHLEIGKPDLPYLHLLDIVIGGQVQKDAPPALVVKNGGRLDIHGQFDEAGNNLISLQSAQPDQARMSWINIQEDAKRCQLSSINFAGFASLDHSSSANLKWTKAAGFIRSCNFRNVQGQQIWLDQTSIKLENNQIKSIDGAALVLAPSGKGAENLIRNNRFEVSTRKQSFLAFAIEIGHPLQHLENNSLLVENCQVGILYECKSSSQLALDKNLGFSLKDNNIYQKGKSELITTGLQFDICNGEKEWLSQANQIKGFDLGARVKQGLIVENWDLNDNVIAMEGANYSKEAYAMQDDKPELTAKGGQVDQAPQQQPKKYKHKILARAAKMEIYLWRLLYSLNSSDKH